MTSILITRPKKAANTVAQNLQKQGYNTLIESVLTYRSVSCFAPPPRDIQALILTSATALDYPPENLHDYKSMTVYCVGDKTAAAAKDFGFKKVKSANGNVRNLYKLISQNISPSPTSKPLLYLRASHIAEPLDRWLGEINIPTINVISYATDPSETLAPFTQSAIENSQIDVILFYSARSAQTFATLIRKHNLTNALKGTKALSISPSVLGYISDLGWKDLHIAAQPNQDSVLSKLTQICPPQNK